MVENRVVVGFQRPPARDRGVPGGVLGRERTAVQIAERRVVGRDQRVARAQLGAHVAQCQPLVDAHRAHRAAGVLHRVTGAGGDPFAADQLEHDVLRGHAASGHAVDDDAHRAHPPLQHALRGERVQELRRADDERERAERAVGRRVAVGADHRAPGPRQPELRSDDMDDPLARVVRTEAENAVLRARGGEPGDDRRHRTGPQRRHAMVGHRDAGVGPGDRESALVERLERATVGAVVHQVQVDVDDRRMPGLLRDHVRVPQLVVERGRGYHVPHYDSPSRF